MNARQKRIIIVVVVIIVTAIIAISIMLQKENRGKDGKDEEKQVDSSSTSKSKQPQMKTGGIEIGTNKNEKAAPANSMLEKQLQMKTGGIEIGTNKNEKAAPANPMLDYLIKNSVNEIVSTSGKFLQDMELLHQSQTKMLSKYKHLHGKPGVISGKIEFPAMSIDVPVKIRLRKGKKLGGEKIIAAKEGYFAFSDISTDKYELVVYETSETPGMRYEDIDFDQKDGLDLDLPLGDSKINMILVDEDNHGIGGASVTIGKSGGGKDPRYFTYKRGVTDQDGKFSATGLVDGSYVVSAKFGEESISTVVGLNPSSTISEKLELRLSGAQIRGFVRNEMNQGLRKMLIRLQGPGFEKSVMSTDTGEFVLNAIPPDDYLITAMGNGIYLADSIPVKITSNDDSRDEINLRLYELADAATIEGHVKQNSKGFSSDQMAVILISSSMNFSATASVSPKDGKFSLQHCPPGKYSLQLLGTKDGTKIVLINSMPIQLDKGSRIKGVVF